MVVEDFVDEVEEVERVVVEEVRLAAEVVKKVIDEVVRKVVVEVEKKVLVEVMVNKEKRLRVNLKGVIKFKKVERIEGVVKEVKNVKMLGKNIFR